MNKLSKSGSLSEFDDNWKNREETEYTHWTKDKIVNNQIQFAFRSHYEVFSEIINQKKGKSLEIGCGRGSLSSYFADDNWETDLLDGSNKIIEVAKKIFLKNNHKANFYLANAENLPLDNNIYDVVFSIGLIEHFKYPEKVIQEHYRVAKPGGWVILYIVPNKISEVQKKFNLFNKLLKVFFSSKKKIEKKDVYRTNYSGDYYNNLIKKFNFDKKIITGIYSMPMISHSPEFPFSLMPKFFEKTLVLIFYFLSATRKFFFKKNSWLCKEKNGNAILVAIKKSKNL